MRIAAVLALARGGYGLPRMVSERVVRDPSECCKCVAMVVRELCIFLTSMFARLCDLGTVVGRLEEGKRGFGGWQNKHLCSHKVSRRGHYVRACLSQRSE